MKDRDARTTVFATDDDIFMSGIIETGFDPKNFLRGRYGFGPFFSPQFARALNGRPDFESEDDPEADLADYHATERITAGYAMAELALGPKLTLLPGVRFERTSLDYRGFTLDFDDEGDFAGIARRERRSDLQSSAARRASAVRVDAGKQLPCGAHSFARAAELLRPRALPAGAR